MKGKMMRCTWLAVLSMLSACATTLHEGPKFTEAPKPNSSEALVYIYRPSSPPFWRSPTIYMNDTQIGDLYNKGYTYVYVKPGEHAIKTKWSWDAGVPNLEGKLSLSSGETYFIRLANGMQFSSGAVKTSTTLGTVQNDLARSEIIECMYIKPTVERLQ